ncbi:MAG: hypothetical protein KAX84_14070, partial [Burkholderiales bacterium]|nr:hypothetical protein [Burkholderiales bacterium]
TGLQHYFRTAEVAEALAIDGGAAGPGWQRTGLDFTAFVAGAGPGNDVCRFYNPVANTHFYTADPDECTQVKLPDSGWRYEGLSFRIRLPSAGACAAGTIPVYRNYNNRFAFNDSNHRFTTSLAVYNDMIAQGWAGEGVVMCALPDMQPAFSPTANTSIGGTVNFESVTIPAGVTVTVSSDLALSSGGPITIAGTLAGDCKAVSLMANGQLDVSGTIDNQCATMPAGPPPALTLAGFGGYQFTGGGSTTSSGDVLITNDEAIPPRDAAGAAALLAATVREKATAVDYDCVSSNRFWFTRPLHAPDGAHGGATGEPGEPGRTWTLGCRGNGFIDSTTVFGQDGGRGGNGTHNSAVAAVAKGGAGGAGALLLVYVTAQLDFGSNNFLNGGVGGDGGSANATSTTNAAAGVAPPATATGGKGGEGGTVTVRGLGGITIAGALTLNVGNGGHGGDATALAADGVDSTAAKAAQPGGTATANGGDGGGTPNKQLTSNGNVGGLGNVQVTGGNGGTSGIADATGGKGGDGVVIQNKDGAVGGGVIANGGRGGSSLVTNLAGAPVGAGGNSSDVFFRRGLGGHGYNDCVAPLTSGGRGGDGGPASGGARFGGTGLTNGADGIAREIVHSNGGNGGHGLGPGKRGEAGDNGIVTAGNPAVTPPIFTPGVPGRGCRFTITITVASDPAPAHEGFVGYGAITILDALVDNDLNTITFRGIAGGKWIVVSGPYNKSTGEFTASGAGTAAGIPNVPATFTGVINLASGQIAGEVTLSGSATTPPNGLPGHSTTYNVNGTVLGVSPPAT